EASDRDRTWRCAAIRCRAHWGIFPENAPLHLDYIHLFRVFAGPAFAWRSGESRARSVWLESGGPDRRRALAAARRGSLVRVARVARISCEPRRQAGGGRKDSAAPLAAIAPFA